MRSDIASHGDLRAIKSLCIRIAVLHLVAVMAVACESTATSPSTPSGPAAPPAFNIQGTWQGQYREIRCQSSTCPVCCTSRGKTLRQRELQLRVTQAGSVVSGRWEEELLEFQGVLRGDISGQVSGIGVSLGGLLYPAAAVAAPVPPAQEPWTLKEFIGQLSDDGTAIRGSFVLASLDWRGRETMRLVNDITSLNRVR